jgi:hypothetical protein
MKGANLISIFLVLTALWSFSEPALATLGEKVESIARDSKTLRATQKTAVSGTGFTVQEMTSDANTVREYLTPSGVVFAVAWNGLAHPDLTTLLGSYAPEFQEAKRKMVRKPGQKRMALQGSRVVVETWGHMRNLQGRAYVPILIPEGVTIDEIR